MKKYITLFIVLFCFNAYADNQRPIALDSDREDYKSLKYSDYSLCYEVTNIKGMIFLNWIEGVSKYEQIGMLTEIGLYEFYKEHIDNLYSYSPKSLKKSEVDNILYNFKLKQLYDCIGAVSDEIHI